MIMIHYILKNFTKTYYPHFTEKGKLRLRNGKSPHKVVDFRLEQRFFQLFSTTRPYCYSSNLIGCYDRNIPLRTALPSQSFQSK